MAVGKRERTTESAGETAVNVGRHIAFGARWAHLRATEGNAAERRFAAGGMVVLAVVLAIATGALAVAAVHGNGGAAFGVIVLGLALGMSLLGTIVLAVRGTYAGESLASSDLGVREADPEARALARELEHAVDVLGLGGKGWPVGRESLARWIAATPGEIDGWLRGSGSLSPAVTARVRAFVDMADTLEDTIRPERLPLILATGRC